MTTRITEMMLISTRKFVERNYLSEGWTKVIAALQPDTKRLFDRPLDASKRFDFAIAKDILDTISKELGGVDRGDEVIHRLGMHNAEDDLNVTEKFFMRILTIKMVLKIASFLWTKRVLDGGEMVIFDKGKTTVTCDIQNPPDVADNWWKYLAGWFQRTIELAGGKDVRSKWTGGASKKGEHSHFEVSWR